MSKQSSKLLADNPYRSLRIGLHDNRMLNLTPFFSPEWFTDAFIKLFGYPLFYFNSMWNRLFDRFFYSLLLIRSLVFIVRLLSTIF